MGLDGLILENILGTLNYISEETKNPPTESKKTHEPENRKTLRFWFWTANFLVGITFLALLFLETALSGGSPHLALLFSPLLTLFGMTQWFSFFCLPFIAVLTYLVIKLASGNLILKKITVGAFMLGIECGAFILLTLSYFQFEQAFSLTGAFGFLGYALFALLNVLIEYYLISGFELFLLKAH